MVAHREDSKCHLRDGWLHKVDMLELAKDEKFVAESHRSIARSPGLNLSSAVPSQ